MNRFYVDFHVVQTVPPSCVNRDDTGRPKTAVYGGVNRSRVSSQAWKHAMREMFTEFFEEDKLGYRTKCPVKVVADKIMKLSEDTDYEQAEKLAVKALENVGISVKDKKPVMLLISSLQSQNLAELILNGEKDKTIYKSAFKESPSIDMVLFGRMLAFDQNLNYDACCQVAHSISTHAVQTEYDYFTVDDDCSKNDNAGSGYLGTMEFNSSTLYRYANVNIPELQKYIKEDTAIALKGFAEAFIRSMPTGKQNSYANRTLPYAVYVTIRDDQPVNLCGAFEKPIYSNCGYAEKSTHALFDYADKIYKNYCGTPVKSFVIGDIEKDGAKKVNLNELLNELYDYVKNSVINEVV